MSTAPQVFDCFTFSNELDLLEFRLNLLRDVVDRWVIVEADHTHSGLPKPLHFQQSAHRFDQYRDRILHVVVHDLPAPVPDRWAPEHFQRNAIRRGLAEAEEHDLIVVSDVDEIPDPQILEQLKQSVDDETVALEMRTCYYFGNWESKQTWAEARVVRAGSLGDAQTARVRAANRLITNAGCHLSYLMPPSEIASKLGAFAHAELDTPRHRAPRHLTTIRAAGVTPHHAELLTVRSVDQLSFVQASLLEQRPDLFRFTSPPPSVRRLCGRWSAVRARWSLPGAAVAFGDCMIAAVTSRFA